MDKNLKQEFKSIDRPFSRIEAMYSYTLDADNGKVGTIAGYAQLWQWSRNKVRKFVTEIRSDEGHLRDSRRTAEGHPIHFIDKGFWGKEDSRRTAEGQKKDTTNNPNPNPISKLSKDNLSPEPDKPDSSDGIAPRRCPHKKIQELYNRTLGDVLPYCRVTDRAIDSNLRTRWREKNERQNLEWWGWYFGEIAKSDFLMGRTEKSFLASFDWIIRPKNMTKILNGNYANRGAGSGKQEKLSDYMRRTDK